ncbi:hypothetical protein Ahy_A06g030684 [Arachis hypogaea]|uniref:Aminotransferase-like plant mobile domain-containing protein n=1 Tax=Arachis hypogaea TaxID=3818 RepID=A0A445CWY2_ARAHY|nr:hypothetical protein Ahy_A06g030684 [Arachis hypogaea]
MRDDPKRLYRLDGLAHIAGAINEEKFAVNCSWFQETFRECPAGADEETVRRYVRAYIMMLLGIQLFVDKSGNRIHIRWLPYMARLEDMGGYSWGSAALAWLYWYMCRVVNRHVVKLASPLQLLQSWIFWRFPGFRPAGYDTFIWPLASRWSGHNPSTSEKGPRVQMWRLRIDLLQLGMSPDVLQVVHPEVLEPRHTALWRCVTKLIYFAMIKWHQIDRVLPQFDYLGDPRAVPIPVEATQRGAGRVPEIDRVDDVPDRRRVERRARVGTRRSQRGWRWLDQDMEDSDAMGRDGGRRRGRGGRRRARAGVDDHGGHEDRGHDGGGGGGIPAGIGGVSPHPGGHGGEWYGSGVGDDLDQGGGGLEGGQFGDYFVGVPNDDHAVHESQTWVSPGQLFSALLTNDGLDAEFGGSHFLVEISAIMQENDAARRRTQITGTQAHLDVDLNEPPSAPAHEYFALGGTPPSAYVSGIHSVAGMSTAAVHRESVPSGYSARPLPGQPMPPPHADPDDDEDEIEDEEPLVRRGQRTRHPRRCFTGSHLFR